MAELMQDKTDVNMTGRRLPDTIFGDNYPDGVQPGDYWKYMDRTDPSRPYDCGDENFRRGNLTRTVWGFMSPAGSGVGTLMIHTVREEEDGTISVRPGDGSSNSILHQYHDHNWHGYIEHGVWNEC